ncbi:MAG TPA: fused MFS/spermidine synthase [Fimbriiglobus sp.]|jgi:predicted membrane-bound spermidine synthase
MPDSRTPNSILVGTVVFAANAGLLVLQLLAGKFLAPFVGSSLETWSAVIGAVLAGIALGNAYGGRLADANPVPRRLSVVLVIGSLAAAWTAVCPVVLREIGWYRLVPLGPRIPLLAVILCFPASFTLSLVTPLAIRIGLPDVTKAGRAAGRVFALGTLGCLVGNYVTGFYLLSLLPIDVLAMGIAGVMLALAGITAVVFRGPSSVAPRQIEPQQIRPSILPLPRAYLVVFLCSFAAMTLELTAVRLLAQVFGVSLFTWTGAIGVMLAGTAAGNWLGGRAADRSAGPDSLARGLIAAAGSTVLVDLLFLLAVRTDFLPAGDVQFRIVGWSFLLFFVPMLLFGTVSPRVIRLVVPDVESAGRLAGRIYAWSTAGAIAGTFATGFRLIAELGMLRTVLAAALLPLAAVCLVTPVFRRVSLLYPLSIIGGAAFAGLMAFTPDVTQITKETNYYAIYVRPAKTETGELVPNQFTLQLDSLVHSRVDLTDPTFLHYKHERVQMDLLQAAAQCSPNPRVLVIGGGGYTFPRCAKTLLPTCTMDVVEIDPGVTAACYEKLGLDPALGIATFNMDGRQFVTERATESAYDLITLDAVNDLSVPAHLLTLEFDRAVKRLLSPRGIYLLTVIDVPARGRLWTAAVRTLQEAFPYVVVLSGADNWNPDAQSVLVIYAADTPFVLPKSGRTKVLPQGEIERYLSESRPVVLTDRYAPVDQLMADVFRIRKMDR